MQQHKEKPASIKQITLLQFNISQGNFDSKYIELASSWV